MNTASRWCSPAADISDIDQLTQPKGLPHTLSPGRHRGTVVRPSAKYRTIEFGRYSLGRQHLNMRRNTKRFVAFTSLHAILALGAVLYAMAAGSAQFDNPDLPRMVGADIVEATANTLTLPGRLLWTSWASQNLPNVVEWVLFIANSVLWGALAVTLTNVVS